jgi:hypothetical protein
MDYDEVTIFVELPDIMVRKLHSYSKGNLILLFGTQEDVRVDLESEKSKSWISLQNCSGHYSPVLASDLGGCDFLLFFGGLEELSA